MKTRVGAGGASERRTNAAQSKDARAPKKRQPVVLVFGESPNDRRAIQRLVRGLKPNLDASVEVRHDPLVMMKGSLPPTRRSNAEEIARLAKAEAKVRGVLAVVAHEDCDQLEPAHIKAAQTIEASLREAGCPGKPIGVAPAWEIEAWWLVFPEAVKKVCPSWREPSDWVGKDVGKVTNAKEALTRALRPKGAGAKHKREYQEADSVDIAQNITDMKLLEQFEKGAREQKTSAGKLVQTRSDSLEQFRLKVLAI